MADITDIIRLGNHLNLVVKQATATGYAPCLEGGYSMLPTHLAKLAGQEFRKTEECAAQSHVIPTYSLGVYTRQRNGE